MLRALIADDEEIIRNGLKELVEGSGLDITVIATAKNGEEALAAVQQYSPELILMDINMPLMDGLSAIRQIRQSNREAKIIIVSGYGEFAYAQRALELGVYAYLLKPLDYRRFTGLLQQAAEDYSQRIWELNRLNREAPRADSCQDTGVAALTYLQENFIQSELSLGLVAEQFHLSPSYLSKLIKQKTGSGFTDYIGKLRISLASTLLCQPEQSYSIGEIAEHCGYSSPHYFSRAFKNATGVAPLRYREQARTKK